MIPWKMTCLKARTHQQQKPIEQNIFVSTYTYIYTWKHINNKKGKRNNQLEVVLLLEGLGGGMAGRSYGEETEEIKLYNSISGKILLKLQNRGFSVHSAIYSEIMILLFL